MEFHLTIRYGHRYHLLSVEAPDAVAALREGAARIPPEIVDQVDLVELRKGVDPEERPYAGGGEGG